MKNPKGRSPGFSDLRRRAEKQLQEAIPPEELSSLEAARLIHELRVHQIELEMQNEELRRAQAEIEESRGKYSDLYDFAPTGYLTLDRRGQIVEANLTAATILRVERSRLLGHHFPHFLVEADRPVFRRLLANALELPEGRGEVRLRVGKGEVRTMLLSLLLRQSPEGQERYRLTMTDIAELKEAERKASTIGRLYRFLSKVNETIVRAQDQETLFQATCRIAVEDGGFLMAWFGLADPDGRALRPVVKCGDDTGYLDNLIIPLTDSPESRGVTGTSVREGRVDICNDFAADPRMAPWREKGLGRGFRSCGAFPLRVGTRVVGAFTIYAESPGFFDAEEIALLERLAGNLSYALEALEREDQRRLAEAALRQARDDLEQRVQERTLELEQANQELDSFSYSVAHDLKTPLRTIEGFSRMLLREHPAGLDEEGRRLLGVVIDSTNKMRGLIDDLLNLARLARQPMRKMPLDLTGMAKEVFERLKSQQPERDLQLIAKESPPGWGDYRLLYQVLMNLLENALKFTRENQTAVIEVGGRSEGRENIYYVRDNGVGFSEADIHKMFVIFQRLHDGKKYEGTGVGLATVQRIIQRHGGRVWAEGRVGEGATFYFALPAPRNEA